MSFRAFISVDLDKFDALEALAREITATGAGVKVVNVDSMHLTLKFLGDTAENLVPSIVAVIKDSVQGLEPFKMKLNGTGAFPNIDYMRVVWVGLDDQGLLAPVAKKIDVGLHKFGFDREERAFSPHVTIARVKSSRGKDRLKSVLTAHRNDFFGEQSVKSIRLKKSILSPQGPTYTTVEEVLF